MHDGQQLKMKLLSHKEGEHEELNCLLDIEGPYMHMPLLKETQKN